MSYPKKYYYDVTVRGIAGVGFHINKEISAMIVKAGLLPEGWRGSDTSVVALSKLAGNHAISWGYACIPYREEGVEYANDEVAGFNHRYHLFVAGNNFKEITENKQALFEFCRKIGMVCTDETLHVIADTIDIPAGSTEDRQERLTWSDADPMPVSLYLDKETV